MIVLFMCRQEVSKHIEMPKDGNIAQIEFEDFENNKIYTQEGKPTKTLQKGVNIIRYSDGQVKKVLVR